MTRRSATRAVVCSALIAGGPVLSHVVPGVLSPLRAFILASAACFVAMALSLDVLSGHAGLPSLGHGALLAVGALTSGLATGRWYLPFAAGVVLAAVVTAAVALAVAVPAVRMGAASFALVTLALGLVLEQSLFRWRWITRGTALVVLPRPQLGSFVFQRSADYLAIAVAVAVLAWIVEGNLARSSFGRALHLVRDDEQVARAMGIDPFASRVAAFGLSGAMAGMAGATFGHLVITVSADTFRYSVVSLPLLSLVVVGGAGSRAGVAVVGGTYAVMPRILSLLEGWDAIVAGLLFVFTVVHNPGGLAATVARARRRRLDAATVHAAPFTAPKGLLAPSPSGEGRLATAGEEAVLMVTGLDVDRGSTPVLREVSLAVTAGRVVAVVGPNGAGKSTLLDAISGFVRRGSGNIVVDGTEVASMPADRRRSLGVGRTFQRLGLPGSMPLREAILVGGDIPRKLSARRGAVSGPDGAENDQGAWPRLAELVGTPAARRRQRRSGELADATLDRLGLRGLGEVPVGELSVGQQRLVELAVALGGDQRLLLLDEPSAGLAPAAVEALARHIKQLREAGRAILLVEHDLPLVRAVSDEVVVLAGGRVLASGPAPGVLARPDVAAAWLGAAPLDP